MIKTTKNFLSYRHILYIFEKNDSLTFFGFWNFVTPWQRQSLETFLASKNGFQSPKSKNRCSLPSNKKFLISLILFLISCWRKMKISWSAPALGWWENKTCSAWLLTFFRVNNIDFPKISRFCTKNAKWFHEKKLNILIWNNQKSLKKSQKLRMIILKLIIRQKENGKSIWVSQNIAILARKYRKVRLVTT